MQRILLAILAAVIGIDAVWEYIARFDVDATAYFGLGALVAVFLGGGYFYEHIRKDRGLSGMLFGTGFMIGFSASFSVLNYFLLTIAGPRIDRQLAAVDRAMGFDWPAMMAFAAAHPALNSVFYLAYSSVLFQIPLLIVCLGCRQRQDEIGAFCMALSLSAFAAAAVWALYPSFGAFSVYPLPVPVADKMVLALDGRYAHALVGLLANGPGHIAPREMRGLIGFPSFHIVMAILVTWYARSWRPICIPLAVLNLLVAVSTPVQGGHHAVDVLGGIGLAAITIAVTGGASARAPAGKPKPGALDFGEVPFPAPLPNRESA